nr:transposase zinc-binding domain-containing protein [Enterobacter hormaechei]
MHIPRPAKLLFTVDDGWNRYLEKHGDSISQWTRLCVERMLACGTCAMGVRRYCCASPDCTHSRFFCQSCKSKACSACGMKSTEQWTRSNSTSCPTVNGSISPLPCPTYCGPSSTTTGPCSTTCSAAPPGLC